MSTDTANLLSDLDPSPIDLVEDLAALKSWDADRLGDDQINMAVEGRWCVYGVSLVWDDPEEILRLVCTFEMPAVGENRPELLKAIEAANDQLWIGCFNYWSDVNMIAFRYGLALHGGATPTSEQIDAVLHSAVEHSEQFFPVFDLVARQGMPAEIAAGAAWDQSAGQA